MDGGVLVSWMTLPRCLFPACALLLVTAAGPARAASILALGDVPGGNFTSQANAVSADGLVVVGQSGFQAFRWTAATGMIGLGFVPSSPLQRLSDARAVSMDGSVIVGYATVPVPTFNKNGSFLWTPGGGMQNFNVVGSAGTTALRAHAITPNGTYVAGGAGQSSPAGPFNSEAFRWSSSDGLVRLGFVAGTPTESLATGISADGAVVVGYSGNSPGGTAFRWTQATGMVGLGVLAGDEWSAATAVSADGAVIVGHSVDQQIVVSGGIPELRLTYRAFRWTSGGGLEALGDGEALAVSADGTRVVGKGSGPTRAFLWDEAHGRRDLRELLEDDYGLDMSGWTLESATGISADGTVIVGTGYNPNVAGTDGNPIAWMVIIPEPGTALLVGAGLVLLSSGRRSRVV